jgi:hypothetical protein
MKECDYCGRQNDDTATKCHECGSSAFTTQAQPSSAIEPRTLEPEEASPVAFAEREGNVVTLKCRTLGEASLVSDELRKADIVTLLPGDDELLLEYKQKGFVELRVSAKAYESVADLRSSVEFQYQRLPAEQPLPYSAKAVALCCGFVIVPGLLVFVWLLSSYQAHGYHRMAKEFKLWFFIGVASWLLVVCGLVGWLIE